MSIFTGKRALLLDFDGTIGDTFALHETAFQVALAPYGLPFVYKEYIGQSTGEVFEQLFKKAAKEISADDLAALVKIKRQAANDRYSTHLKFMDGAEAFLHTAFDLGYELYVGSSGSRRNILAGIERLGLTKYISYVVTADDVTYGKPHPEIFQLLLDRAGLSPAEALVIEDAPSGLEAAITAGLEVVCIDPELREGKYNMNRSVHFATFAELLMVITPPAK